MLYITVYKLHHVPAAWAGKTLYPALPDVTTVKILEVREQLKVKTQGQMSPKSDHFHCSP